MSEKISEPFPVVTVEDAYRAARLAALFEDQQEMPPHLPAAQSGFRSRCLGASDYSSSVPGFDDPLDLRESSR